MAHHTQMETEHVDACNRRTNLGTVERVLSAGTGAKLILAGLTRRGSLVGKLLTLAGSGLVYRGASGYCPAYAAVGASGNQPFSPFGCEMRVKQAITINRPAEDLYTFWRELSNLPDVMGHVHSIEVLDEQRSRWCVAGPGKSRIEWEALITVDEPNSYLEWTSVSGDYVQHRGAVEFVPTRNRGTIVRVLLLYRPLGGAVAALLAKAFRREPGQEIRDDLRRFKQLMESGEVADSAGPSARLQDSKKQRRVSRPRRAAARASRPTADAEDELRPQKKKLDDVVDEASEESFPASDPPAWTHDPTEGARH